MAVRRSRRGGSVDAAGVGLSWQAMQPWLPGFGPQLATVLCEWRPFFVCEYGRSPKSFQERLEEDPRLAACAHALRDAGHEGPATVKIFVAPEEFEAVCEVLHRDGTWDRRRHRNWEDLRPRHVVTNAGYREIVEEVLRGCRASDRVKQVWATTSYAHVPAGASLRGRSV